MKTSNITIQFILFIFPDRHINFWTTVEDGNLSQTIFLSILLFENTNIKLDFPHLICERPPSIIIIIIITVIIILVYLTTGLKQAI